MSAVDGVRIERVDGETMLRDWQYVHNEIIPTYECRSTRCGSARSATKLEVAYLGDVLVGCSTVRPPADDPEAATVIARVLPGYRRRGIGGELYARGVQQAREFGATAIETIVLASNVDGLRFAQARGFTEIESYLLPGDTVPFLTLRRATLD